MNLTIDQLQIIESSLVESLDCRLEEFNQGKSSCELESRRRAVRAHRSAKMLKDVLERVREQIEKAS